VSHLIDVLLDLINGHSCWHCDTNKCFSSPCEPVSRSATCLELKTFDNAFCSLLWPLLIFSLVFFFCFIRELTSQVERIVEFQKPKRQHRVVSNVKRRPGQQRICDGTCITESDEGVDTGADVVVVGCDEETRNVLDVDDEDTRRSDVDVGLRHLQQIKVASESKWVTILFELFAAVLLPSASSLGLFLRFKYERDSAFQI